MTDQRKAAFTAVAQAGALTTRRVIGITGPKPNWQILLDNHWLKEYQTPYGSVLALDAKGRQRAADRGIHAPYVAGPASVADRAYQNDALQILIDQGYTLHHHEFKKAGRVGKAAPLGRPFTDQILRSVMQVPAQQMRALVAVWGPGFTYQPERWGNHAQGVGYPYLYASISNGGIKLPKLRALYRKHTNAIDFWRAPLLIAVPEEGDLRAYIRAEETKRRRAFDKLIRDGMTKDRPLYPRVELIILPAP